MIWTVFRNVQSTLLLNLFVFFGFSMGIQRETMELFRRLQEQIDGVADGVNVRIDAVNKRITTLTTDTRNLRDDILLIYSELQRVESHLNDTLKNNGDENRGQRIGTQKEETVRVQIKKYGGLVENEVLKLKNGFHAEKLRNVKYRRSLTLLEEKITRHSDVLDNIGSNIETMGNIMDIMHTNILPNMQEDLKSVFETLLDANRSCQLVEKLESKSHTLSEVLQENITSSLGLIKAISTEVLAVSEKHWKYERLSTGQSCAEIRAHGYTENDVYKVITPAGQFRSLFCDMTVDGGGWLVIQRRTDGKENFFRRWGDYKSGFGDVSGEFWLGNEIIHKFTNWLPHELRIELEDFDGETRYAKYGTFLVGPESDNYTLTVGNYSGNAGDALSGTHHNGQEFSTYDRDNDGISGNCAASREGGWWFWNCATCHLNGPYRGGSFSDVRDNGITWDGFRDELYSLKSAEMKIRPK